MRKYGILLVCCLGLIGCAAEEELSDTPTPLGQFRLGHNIAIADNVTKGPFSRDFTETDLEASVQNAVAKRLRRYDGDGLYHLGIVIGGIAGYYGGQIDNIIQRIIEIFRSFVHALFKIVAESLLRDLQVN